MRLAAIAKHGNVTNVYCVIKWNRIESCPFDSPDRIDSVERIDSNRFFPALIKIKQKMI